MVSRRAWFHKQINQAVGEPVQSGCRPVNGLANPLCFLFNLSSDRFFITRVQQAVLSCGFIMLWSSAAVLCCAVGNFLCGSGVCVHVRMCLCSAWFLMLVYTRANFSFQRTCMVFGVWVCGYVHMRLYVNRFFVVNTCPCYIGFVFAWVVHVCVNLWGCHVGVCICFILDTCVPTCINQFTAKRNRNVCAKE